MWVRSQNNKILSDVEQFEVMNNGQIWDRIKDDKLGEYGTDEKAILVLNDIEYEIKNYNPIDNVCIMPQENEVRGI